MRDLYLYPKYRGIVDLWVVNATYISSGQSTDAAVG